MPRVTRIAVTPAHHGPHADGLKGQLFDQPIAGVDVFVGPNGSGKTTRGILALVAAEGGLAETATDPRKPFLGAAPENTSVTITLDNGDSWTRDLAITKTTNNEHKRATADALRLVGRLPTAWNLSDWAIGTDGDRAKILDAVAKAGGQIERWDASTTQDRVREHICFENNGSNVASSTDHSPEALDQCTAAHPTARDGETWLRSAMHWAKADQQTTNAEQRAAEATWKAAKNKPVPKVEGDAATDEHRRDELLSERAQLRDGQSRRAKVIARQDRSQREGDRLKRARQAQLDEGKRLTKPLPGPGTGPDDDELQARLDKAAEDLQRAEATSKAARAALQASTVECDSARKAKDTAYSARYDAREKLSMAREKVRSLSGQSLGECRECSCADPLNVAGRLKNAHADVKRQGLEVEARSAEAERRNEALREAESALTTAGLTAQKENAALSAAAANVRIAKREFDNAGKRRQTAIDNHATRETQRQNSLASARTRWIAADKAVKEWQTDHDKIVIPPEVDNEARLTEITGELIVIDARDEKRKEARRRAEDIESAATDYMVAKGRWASSRALVSALRETRDELAAAAYAPIEEAARDLLVGVQEYGLPMPYFRGVDDYGARVMVPSVRHGIASAERDVPYNALSESEARITAAALVYALAVVSNQPVKVVLLDGLEVVQSDHRAPLLAALVDAQDAGKVDNVLVTMATATDEEIEQIRMPGLTIHGPEYPAYEYVPAPVLSSEGITYLEALKVITEPAPVDVDGQLDEYIDTPF